jgi:hypothetical protein
VVDARRCSRPVSLAQRSRVKVGTGAGDAAPECLDCLGGPVVSRAPVLDRWFQITPTSTNDGLAESVISPRTAGSVKSNTAPAASCADDTAHN